MRCIKARLQTRAPKIATPLNGGPSDRVKCAQTWEVRTSLSMSVNWTIFIFSPSATPTQESGSSLYSFRSGDNDYYQPAG